MAKNLGKTICLYSPKGGVGKTVLALNLAGVSSSLGYKTLLVDFDIFTGSLSMIINEDITKTIYNFSEDLLNNRFKKIDDYLYKYNENIDVLSSPKDPRQGNKINSKYVKSILEKVKTEYDIIIVDTNNVLNDITLTALDNSDLDLFVITNDLFTLKNTRNVLNIFNDIEKDNYKVLLNLSCNFKTEYFTLNDIKKIIGSNVDYIISKNSYIKDITSYLYDNKIPSLLNAFPKKCKTDYNTMKLIIEDVKGQDKNEE